MGNAYAVWTGIGAVGVIIIAIIWFNKAADLKGIACIGFIVLGIAGLKFLDSGSNIV